MSKKMTLLVGAAIATVAGLANFASAGTQFYTQNNLVSDGTVPGTTADPNLINPWGLAYAPGGPFWVANNNSNTSSIYSNTGSILASPITAVPNNPTGQVYNGSSDFGGSSFIFDGEGGTVQGWTGGSTTNTLVDNTSVNAVFKGLAIANNGGANFLYATDFRNAKIDVFDGTDKPVSLPTGKFTDPNLPAGYAPFNIQTLDGKLYVTYALQDAAKHDDVSGAGHGFVDVYDLSGTNLGRLVTQGVLNSPWGLAIAPSNFGLFSNDLLVGNFGNGKINAFNPTTGSFLGTLSGQNGQPISIEDLWALDFGNGGAGGQTNQLFFSAGLMDESHGLFGHIDAATGTTHPVPLPAMVYVMPLALLIAGVSARKLRNRVTQA
jgi:uncharacterized protein (TIGR03118 family)